VDSAGGFKIFISYARADAAPLARRLLTDFIGAGHRPWLDTDRISGGANWTARIETALDEAQVVIALMSRGSYTSEICRAEQLRALRTGKCVIPLIAQRPVDVRLHLEARKYRDFSGDSLYQDQFEALLRDIRLGEGVPIQPQYKRTYVTLPSELEQFVPRRTALTALRDTLLRERTSTNISVTALVGMGGGGKSQLALSLCRDDVQ
jgi:hypothetical protein